MPLPGENLIMSALSKIAGAFDEMGEKLSASLSGSLSGVQSLFENISSSKTQKTSKSMMGMFKSMAGASVQGAVLKMLFEMLSPFLKLLKMFMPIFKAIGAILTKALMPLMQALMPIILMIVDLIMQFSPILEQIIGIALEPLLMFLDIFMSMMTENQALFDELFNAISMIVGVIAEVMSEILQSGEIMLVMKVAIMGLMYVLRAIIFVIKILAVVIKAIVAGIKWFINAIKTLIGWVRQVVDFIMDIVGGFTGGGILKAQRGAIVSSPTLFGLAGEGGSSEAIIPLDELYKKFDSIELAIDRHADYTKYLVRRKVMKDYETVEEF